MKELNMNNLKRKRAEESHNSPEKKKSFCNIKSEPMDSVDPSFQVQGDGRIAPIEFINIKQEGNNTDTSLDKIKEVKKEPDTQLDNNTAGSSFLEQMTPNKKIIKILKTGSFTYPFIKKTKNSFQVQGDRRIAPMEFIDIKQEGNETDTSLDKIKEVKKEPETQLDNNTAGSSFSDKIKPNKKIIKILKISPQNLITAKNVLPKVDFIGTGYTTNKQINIEPRVHGRWHPCSHQLRRFQQKAKAVNLPFLVKDIIKMSPQDFNNVSNVSLDHSQMLLCNDIREALWPEAMGRSQFQINQETESDFSKEKIHTYHKQLLERKEGPLYNKKPKSSTETERRPKVCPPNMTSTSSPGLSTSKWQKKRTKKFTKEQKNEIINECVVDKVSSLVLAKKWNCSPDTIRTWVHRKKLAESV